MFFFLSTLKVIFSLIASLQKRESEIAHDMKVEHERASAALRQKEIERYEENVHYQQQLEKQLEVSLGSILKLEIMQIRSFGIYKKLIFINKVM